MKRLLFLLLIAVSFQLEANVSVYEFESIAQEKRFQQLVAILRCPTCQNQNLADSNSIVAEDLKQIVYEKIKAGESDEEILNFMKQRYGEFILYQPEVTPSNAMLWAGPFIFLMISLIGFFVWYFRNKGEVTND